MLIDDAGSLPPANHVRWGNPNSDDGSHRQGRSHNLIPYDGDVTCSPTRASLLTGRNHHRVGAGQIAELANDWDGYSGHIPKSSACWWLDVLKGLRLRYGSLGQWHNTPAEETTPAGPVRELAPTSLGFEYFYGFSRRRSLAMSQPNLWFAQHQQRVLPLKTVEEGYHLSEDLADDAISWLNRHKAFQPDKPFLMYWASGAILRSAHHVMKEWADKYKGKFDDGWDAYRERVFKRAKGKGWLPAFNALLTPRHETHAVLESIPEDEKAFQRRLIDGAGFAEHVDVQVLVGSWTKSTSSAMATTR